MIFPYRKVLKYQCCICGIQGDSPRNFHINGKGETNCMPCIDGYRYPTQMKELLDNVDSCMMSLGIVLNIAENCMNYDNRNTEEALQAVRDEYRKLSDAIIALRGKEGDK